MEMETEAINLLNEDGTLRTKDEFLLDMENFYNNYTQATKVESIKNKKLISFLNNYSLQENSDSSIEKYQFLDRKLYLNLDITSGIPIRAEDEGREIPDVGLYILERIQFWNAEDDSRNLSYEERHPIKIYIDSPGGSVVTTLQIIDTIKNSKTPVYTIVTGAAFSGGFFVAIAGHKRFAFPNATFLFHEGACEIYGDSHKAKQKMEYQEMLISMLKKHTISSTTISEMLYEQKKKDDWFFDAEEALKYGVIDKITTNVNGG